MLRVSCRHPVQICSVTLDTILRKIGSLVVWSDRIFIIVFMTRYAIRWCIGVVRASMTSGAIRNIVSLGQREKIMIYLVRLPVITVRIMAFRTIGGKAGSQVIGSSGGRKFRTVAIDAIISNALELQSGFRFMAIHTRCKSMCSYKGKTIIMV